MRRILFSLLLAGVLASCANSDSEPRPRLPTDAEVLYYNSIAPVEDHIACFTRVELGSRFPRRYCYRVADLESIGGLQVQNVFDMMKVDGLLETPIGLP